MYPSISVVIPSYNQGQYIEETLLSVIGQQYPNLEILVIDGGSTDNTVEIIEKYAKYISYWHSKKDNGQSDAINQGINLSSGEIVCWLNSDDMYLPGTLLDVGKRFIGYTDKNYLIYGAAVTIEQSNEKLYGGAQLAAPFEAFRLTYDDFIVQPSSFWTRKLWQSTGEINTNYNYMLDWDWFIRASKFTSFEYVHKFYSVYRFHPQHKSGNGGEKRRAEIIDVVNKYSSKYWCNLYEEINMYYEAIASRNQLMLKLKVPRRHAILPIFFPKILSRVQHKQDFLTALFMYGI